MNARAILAQTSESQTRMLLSLTKEEVEAVVFCLAMADNHMSDPTDQNALRAVAERIVRQMNGEKPLS